MLKCPFSYKKWQKMHPRINALKLIGSVSSKFVLYYHSLRLYFITLACFSVILIYPHSIFSYFTILYVTTAVTFPLRPPRLAFAICGRRWQNDVYENKV